MYKALVLSQTLCGLAFAANDWATACTNGQCSFESGDGINTAWAKIDVAGSTSALSDITSAAGWQITGCNPNWSSGVANVTITCTGTPEQTALCSHLFDGGNAVNKVVRLPLDCGTGPFARVLSTSDVETPSGSPEQHLVSLDYEFSQIPENDAQELSFTIGASNVQGGVQGTAIRARNMRRYPLTLVPRFDVSKTIDLPPVTLDKSFNLFNQSFDCPAADGGIGVSASLAVTADAKLDAHMAFGVSISGSIFPFPKVSGMQLTGTLTGSAGATFDITAGATGTFDTGAITLFQAGLPGLSFPGIITIGPQFLLNTQLVAALDLQANIVAGATYQFPEVQLVFPPDAGKSAATITPTPDALNLSLEPKVTAEGSVTAHLIPRVELGIEVLKGLAEATVFLDVDGSAKLGLNAQASAVLAPGEDTQTNVNGCATLDAGVAVNAGATGAIKPIFEKDISFEIFSKDFNLFKKCFGDAPAKRGLIPSQFRVEKRALTCPSPGEGGILANVLSL